MPTALKKSKSITIPTTLGDVFAGGYLAGRIFDLGKPYNLIAAPKSTGEQAEIVWGAADKTIKGALSYSDGPANTAAMAKAGSALAQWVRGLKIGGHSDWYLPSRLEALVLFGELRQVKAFDAGKPEGFERAWYWTSTQYAGEPSWAWYQGFRNGHQDDTRKSHTLRARAVRRIPV
jgi:hypothetical protein